MWAFAIVAISVGLPVGAVLKGWRMFLDGRRSIDPVDLLATRFAAGEINEAEYTQMMRVLTSGPAALGSPRDLPAGPSTG